MGLGPGPNALPTLRAAQAVGAYIEYDALETHPLPASVVAALQPEWDEPGLPLAAHFAYRPAAPWDMPVEMAPRFTRVTNPSCGVGWG